MTMSYRRNSRGHPYLGWLLFSQTLEEPKERGWCLLPQWLLLQQTGRGRPQGRDLGGGDHTDWLPLGWVSDPSMTGSEGH